MNDGVTRYEVMPIPPVEAQTEYFDAGPIRIGVEYRLLNDAIAAAAVVEPGAGSDPGVTEDVDDRGVSLHVFAPTEPGAEPLEALRFDCFDEDPHYHYISWTAKTNEMIHIDPVADGDPLAWALERIRTRLPQMLERAGALTGIDPARLEAALPKVAEAAYRARFHHDDEAVARDALAGPR